MTSWKLAALGRRRAVLLLLVSNQITSPFSCWHEGITGHSGAVLAAAMSCSWSLPVSLWPDSGFLRHMEPLQMPEPWHCLQRGTCCLPELILPRAQAGLIFRRGTTGSRNRCWGLLPFAPEESTRHTQKSAVLHQADTGMARNCLY